MPGIFLAIAVSVAAVEGPDAKCPPALAQRAERDAADASTWDGLFRAYLLYEDCDDGAVGEGFSDSVGRLLATEGRTWERLRELARQDGVFLCFVLRHVDETIPSDTMSRIERLAREQCPKTAHRVCRAVAKAVERARRSATTRRN